MANSEINKILQIFAPPKDLSTFNPGKYFNEMEFTDSSIPYSLEDADGLAQLVFYCDYLALESQSTERENSVLYGDTPFFSTLRTNFSNLEGWEEIEEIIEKQGYIFFTDMVHFLFRFFKPHPPKKG